jgi:hypothetical protein
VKTGSAYPLPKDQSCEAHRAAPREAVLVQTEPKAMDVWQLARFTELQALHSKQQAHGGL